jgi:hypothetical protein
MAEDTKTCPLPGLDGAQIKRGPDKGRCRYELRIEEGNPPYCPIHGPVPDPPNGQLE